MAIQNSTSINGVITANGITGSGINIGPLAPYQEVLIRTSAQVAPASSFATGTTNLTNVAQISADGIAAFSTQLPIAVSNGQVAGVSTVGRVAGVSTGTADSLALSLGLSALITLLYMAYTQTGIFKKREAWSVVKRHRSDKDRFNFAA